MCLDAQCSHPPQSSGIPLSWLSGCGFLRRLLKTQHVASYEIIPGCAGKQGPADSTPIWGQLWTAPKPSPGLEVWSHTEFPSTMSVLEGAGLLGSKGNNALSHSHSLFFQSASSTSGLSLANSDSASGAVWVGAHFSSPRLPYSDPRQHTWPKTMPSPISMR